MPYECTCLSASIIIGATTLFVFGCFALEIIYSTVKQEIQERKKQALDQGEDFTRFTMSLAVKLNMLSNGDINNYRLENFSKRYSNRKTRMKVKK